MKPTLRRRAFLLSGLTAAASFGATTQAAGAQAAETITLWKLSADWGYPAGPKGKTRCKGRACYSHAANKLYLSEAHATAGRTHKCCVAQPCPIEIPVATYQRLTALPPATGAALADLRRPDVAAVIADATRETHSTSSADSPRVSSPERSRRTNDSKETGTAPSELAATGSSMVELVTVAGVLTATGVAATIVASRPSRIQCVPDRTSATTAER